MKTTQTGGNGLNGIRGSRIRVWAEIAGYREMVGELTVPHRTGLWYCGQHPGGYYAKELLRLKILAETREAELSDMSTR